MNAADEKRAKEGIPTTYDGSDKSPEAIETDLRAVCARIAAFERLSEIIYARLFALRGYMDKIVSCVAPSSESAEELKAIIRAAAKFTP